MEGAVKNSECLRSVVNRQTCCFPLSRWIDVWYACWPTCCCCCSVPMTIVSRNRFCMLEMSQRIIGNISIIISMWIIIPIIISISLGNNRISSDMGNNHSNQCQQVGTSLNRSGGEAFRQELPRVQAERRPELLPDVLQKHFGYESRCDQWILMWSMYIYVLSCVGVLFDCFTPFFRCFQIDKSSTIASELHGLWQAPGSKVTPRRAASAEKRKARRHWCCQDYPLCHVTGSVRIMSQSYARR